MTLLLAGSAIVLAAASGLTGFAAPGPRTAQRWAAALMGAAAACAFGGAGLAFARARPAVLTFGGWLGGGTLRLDGFSAIFLVPVFAVGALGSLYGLDYFPAAKLLGKARRWQLFHGLTVASMGLLLLADDAILFLVAWEAVALGSWALVLVEDDHAEAREAALTYLVAAHVGTLALVSLVALLGQAAGSYSFDAMAARAPATPWLLALLLAGFGVKAGLMPLHFWLPGAHAAAPSHVSALLSGVVLKMGVYGIIRFAGLLPAPASWGWALLAAGVTSATLGAFLTLAQNDVKRLLAYCSVENIGIIVMGAGLALLGRASGNAALEALGIAGACFHVLNHAMFKPLLFFGAGALHHATGTRELDRLGGLARRMPATALCFLAGAAAISGLPPFNGFASELLLYLGFGRALEARSALAFAGFGAAALALAGGFAAASFAKAFGMIFLGQPRGPAGGEAHDPGPAMRLAMALPAAVCLALGLFPPLAARVLRSAVSAWNRTPGALLPSWGPAGQLLWRLPIVGFGLLLLLGLAWALRRSRGGVTARGDVWACGYPAPTARMQFTGSSFADFLLGALPWPAVRRPAGEAPSALFPARARFASHVADPVVEIGLPAASRFFARLSDRLSSDSHRAAGATLQGNVLLLLVVLAGLLAWKLIG